MYTVSIEDLFSEMTYYVSSGTLNMHTEVTQSSDSSLIIQALDPLLHDSMAHWLVVLRCKQANCALLLIHLVIFRDKVTRMAW